jgi:hypothetical protein
VLESLVTATVVVLFLQLYKSSGPKATPGIEVTLGSYAFILQSILKSMPGCVPEPIVYPAFLHASSKAWQGSESTGAFTATVGASAVEEGGTLPAAIAAETGSAGAAVVVVCVVTVCVVVVCAGITGAAGAGTGVPVTKAAETGNAISRLVIKKNDNDIFSNSLFANIINFSKIMPLSC